MTKDEWTTRVNEFIGDLAGDADLSDGEYIEVLQDLEDQACTAWHAKQEEIEEDPSSGTP